MLLEAPHANVSGSGEKFTQVDAPKDSLDREPCVAILLCTMQGSRYLYEQLHSIVTQTHLSWSIWVSDDGSSDGTQVILGELQAKLGKDRVSIYHGPKSGFVANFLSLTCRDNIQVDYYAYADQDDIWEADKLAHALERLQTVPSHVPALYCARTRNVDADNNDVGFSPMFAKTPNFANALVQSIAGGNTMVFNDTACQLLRAAGSDVKVASHDWWTYLVVSGCGGKVFYDPRPTVRYRQHSSNLIGSNNSWAGRFVRAGMLLRGRFSSWSSQNLAALQRIRTHLTPENQRRLDEFTRARDCDFFGRLAGMKRSGVYRQTLFGNLGLVVAIIFKKI